MSNSSRAGKNENRSPVKMNIVNQMIRNRKMSLTIAKVNRCLYSWCFGKENFFISYSFLRITWLFEKEDFVLMVISFYESVINFNFSH